VSHPEVFSYDTQTQKNADIFSNPDWDAKPQGIVPVTEDNTSL
jgi:hypothetical protein